MGDQIEISRFTCRYGGDQNLTLGPTDAQQIAGRLLRKNGNEYQADSVSRLKRIHLHDGIISHGIMYDDPLHEDDQRRISRELKAHGHSHGMLILGGVLQFTAERLVLAHNASRSLAHINPNTDKIVGEFVNCICYNPMQQIFDQLADNPVSGSRINIRNCLIKEGPDTKLNRDGTMDGVTPRPFRIGTSGLVHMSGCILRRKDGTDVDAQKALLTYNERKAMPKHPHPVGSVADDPIPADDLYDILDTCGADGEYEEQIRDQVRNGTGHIFRNRLDIV